MDEALRLAVFMRIDESSIHTYLTWSQQNEGCAPNRVEVGFKNVHLTQESVIEAFATCTWPRVLTTKRTCFKDFCSAMPLIGMAEATSRGDIIVDEVDALKRSADPKYTRKQSGERSRPATILHNLPIHGASGQASTVPGDGGFGRNRVLVDEVDFVRAAEQGLIHPSELHVAALRTDSPTVSTVSRMEGDRMREGSNRNRLLVDEVDFIRAVEQGEINPSDSHTCTLLYESSNERLGGHTGVHTERMFVGNTDLNSRRVQP